MEKTPNKSKWSFILLMVGIFLAFMLAFSARVAIHFTLNKMSPGVTNIDVFWVAFYHFLWIVAAFCFISYLYLGILLEWIKRQPAHLAGGTLATYLTFISLVLLPIGNPTTWGGSPWKFTLILAACFIIVIISVISYAQKKGLKPYNSKYLWLMLVSSLLATSVASYMFYGYTGRYIYFAVLMTSTLIFARSLLTYLRAAKVLLSKKWDTAFILCTTLLMIIAPSLFMGVFVASDLQGGWLELNIAVPIAFMPMWWIMNKYFTED